MNENKIVSLEADLFAGFVASDTLDTLILNKNQIEVVPDLAFKHLVGLNSLEIVNNAISLVEDDAFYNMDGKLSDAFSIVC